MPYFPEIFKGTKVGDNVFGADDGWGVVVNIREEKRTVSMVFRDLGVVQHCNFDGRTDENYAAPTFWPERFVPGYYLHYFPAPKKLVKKTVDMWLNIYPYPNQLFAFKSEEDADASANLKKRLGSACHVVHEYFEEE